MKNSSLTLTLTFSFLLELGLCLGFGEYRRNEKKSYYGYKLISVTPTSDDEVQLLRTMQVEDDKVDFWTEPTRPGNPAKIMVSRDSDGLVLSNLRRKGIKYSILSDNVDQLISRSVSSMSRRNLPVEQEASPYFDLNDFNSLDNIQEWLNTTVNSCPPCIKCELVTIGYTYENRSIDALMIYNPKLRGRRKTVFVDGAVHAREWLTTVQVLKLIDRLVHGDDTDAKKLRTRYRWFIIPVANPDGYVYTHNIDRLWRKNRSPNANNAFCPGTDINRNFQFHWGEVGTSSNPCSSVYGGRNASSELETQAMQKILSRYRRSILLYFSLHAYGNMILFPYGFKKNGKCARSPDHEKLMDVADAAGDAMQNVSQSRWKRGTICEAIYATSGSSLEYAAGVGNVPFSYCFEVQGDDFLVPKSIIPESFNETWVGLNALLNRIDFHVKDQRDQRRRRQRYRLSKYTK